MVTELKSDWEDVLSKERIAVVKIYGDWCGPCKFFAPHFNRYSENIPVYMDTEIKYYQSNNDKNKTFSKMYEVDRLPSVIFLVYGVMVYKIQGVTRQFIFEDILKKSLEVKYKLAKG